MKKRWPYLEGDELDKRMCEFIHHKDTITPIAVEQIDMVTKKVVQTHPSLGALQRAIDLVPSSKRSLTKQFIQGGCSWDDISFFRVSQESCGNSFPYLEDEELEGRMVASSRDSVLRSQRTNQSLRTMSRESSVSECLDEENPDSEERRGASADPREEQIDLDSDDNSSEELTDREAILQSVVKLFKEQGITREMIDRINELKTNGFNDEENHQIATEMQAEYSSVQWTVAKEETSFSDLSFPSQNASPLRGFNAFMSHCLISVVSISRIRSWANLIVYRGGWEQCVIDNRAWTRNVPRKK